MRKLLISIMSLLPCAALAGSGLAVGGGYHSSVSDSHTTSGYQSHPGQTKSYSSTETTSTSSGVSYEADFGDISRGLLGVIAEDMRANKPAHIHHRHHHYKGSVMWLPMRSGDPLPGNIVVGGHQINPRTELFVCRAHYNGSVHPGKVYQGNCDIAYGGREIILNHYEVLVSTRLLKWVDAAYGEVPNKAIQGGHEDGHPVYICQAHYQDGVHPGKIHEDACNIPWGGQEISLHHYSVLTA